MKIYVTLFITAVLSLNAVPTVGQEVKNEVSHDTITSYDGRINPAPTVETTRPQDLTTPRPYNLKTLQPHNLKQPHDLTLKRIAIPAALVGIGVWGVGNDWMDGFNREVREEVNENIDTKITVDDYMQLVPAVATLALGWCGLKPKHTMGKRLVIMAMATAIMGTTVTGMKYAWGELRPDGTTRNSFPSGHTATAFMGAEMLRIEYGHHSPWIAVAGYTVATGVGFFRVYNNRHWVNDIIAGAGIGMLSTRLAYWLYPKIFGKKVNGHLVCPQVVASPYYYNGSAGLQATILF